MSFEKLKLIGKKHLLNAPFDHLAVGILSLESKDIQSYSWVNNGHEILDAEIYFDLASITKPLTLSHMYFKYPKKFTKEMLALLEHRGGLPAWGVLSKSNWKDWVSKFKVSESATLYSDYSALRLQIELEKIGLDLKTETLTYIDKDCLHWLDLKDEYCPPTGFRANKIIQGQVHDPNAYNLKTFTAHAGLFSTIDGLLKSILNLDREFNFVDQVLKELKGRKEFRRFVFGWDRAEDPSTTLAGAGCSEYTFGHLGFTGTSIWIDPVKKICIAVLSNATKNHWYQKTELNSLRRELGEITFKSF